MISSINDKAAEVARMMTEWAADELRAIGLPVSVAIKKGVPGRVIIEEAQSGKPIPFSLDRASSAAFWKGSCSAVFLPN